MVQTRSQLAKKSTHSRAQVAAPSTSSYSGPMTRSMLKKSSGVSKRRSAAPAAAAPLSVQTRSMVAKQEKSVAAPVSHAREPYELRPRKQRIIVTIPMTPYFLRPRITFA